jgi:hypothetical protein
MKYSFLISLRRSAIAMLVIGSLVALSAPLENGYFEFCTTKAYGWPAPWKIDYCLCEGGETIYPRLSATINIGIALAAGIGTFIMSFAMSIGGASRSASNAEQVVPPNGP